ncbi:MAG: acylneuraminate cytidylyltransferase family protein [Lachnospiraceae bacterium]|nr:acylneuraminate cytidylyltransferase family protein [Lachnospiraceae bacterium]
MIAVIPARGGSKGLPGKNIRELCGKPLIAHTIEAALHAKEIHRTVVSTDSEEIAEIARKYGAEVPFLRPESLASDTASAVDVYIHFAEYMAEHYGEDMNKFMVLLPTAPLRNEKNIDEAVRLWRQRNASTLISMTEAETPVSWYYVENDRGCIENAGFDAANAVNNRQVNRKYYIPNGAIYILDYMLLKNKRTYYDDNTIAYIMDKENSIDIDTKWDFELVEYKMRKERKGGT